MRERKAFQRVFSDLKLSKPPDSALERNKISIYLDCRQAYPEPDHPLVKNEMDPEFKKELESVRSEIDSAKLGQDAK